MRARVRRGGNEKKSGRKTDRKDNWNVEGGGGSGVISACSGERSGGIWRFAGTFRRNTETQPVVGSLVAATNTALWLPRALSCLPLSLSLSISLSVRSSIRRSALALPSSIHEHGEIGARTKRYRRRGVRVYRHGGSALRGAARQVEGSGSR